MKEILLLLLCFMCFNLGAQEVEEIYKFKEEKIKRKFPSGKKWQYYELDSLTLFKNQDFHRFQFFSYHEIRFIELKGTWEINQDTLILSISKLNEIKNNKEWIKQTDVLKYRMRNSKLIPINGHKLSAYKKLKQIK